MRTAVVLAGGQGSRLNYVEKALLNLRGKPIPTNFKQRFLNIIQSGTFASRQDYRSSHQSFRAVIPGTKSRRISLTSSWVITQALLDRLKTSSTSTAPISLRNRKAR